MKPLSPVRAMPALRPWRASGIIIFVYHATILRHWLIAASSTVMHPADTYHASSTKIAANVRLAAGGLHAMVWIGADEIYRFGGWMKSIERLLEAGIFASRWLLAPFYAGLALSLLLLLFAFAREFIEFIPQAAAAPPGTVIVTVLSLVDIVMVANLVLLIMFAGYEIFVSKIDTSNSEDRPDWMGLVSFSDLKIKLMGTIVAISGIELLKTFVNVKAYVQDPSEVAWRLGLHLTFVVSGVLFALMDRLAGGAKLGQDR